MASAKLMIPKRSAPYYVLTANVTVHGKRVRRYGRFDFDPTVLKTHRQRENAAIKAALVFERAEQQKADDEKDGKNTPFRDVARAYIDSKKSMLDPSVRLEGDYEQHKNVAPEFMEYLKTYRDQWLAQKHRMGSAWQTCMDGKWESYRESLQKLRGKNFIVINDFGWPISPDHYGKIVDRVAEKAGIRKIHPHMFRHTFVSILLSNPDIGVATVAAEAGHAQPSTTLAIYTQVYHKRQDSIRSQMSETLYKRKTPER